MDEKGGLGKVRKRREGIFPSFDVLETHDGVADYGKSLQA